MDHTGCRQLVHPTILAAALDAEEAVRASLLALSATRVRRCACAEGCHSIPIPGELPVWLHGPYRLSGELPVWSHGPYWLSSDPYWV
jgi:hypothetical protein